MSVSKHQIQTSGWREYLNLIRVEDKMTQPEISGRALVHDQRTAFTPQTIRNTGNLLAHTHTLHHKAIMDQSNCTMMFNKS